MARTARIFAQIDVNYFEDDRVLDAGPAWQLHFAAILFCKRTLVDGRLSRRQLTRIAPDSVGDVGEAIATLERVELFAVAGDEIIVRSWSDWNESAEDVEAMSKGGERGNHLRWHVRKNVVKQDCPLCVDQENVAPESPPTRVPNPRVDTDPYEETNTYINSSRSITNEATAVAAVNNLAKGFRAFEEPVAEYLAGVNGSPT